jgi:D-galactose 1-dehydrogenase
MKLALRDGGSKLAVNGQMKIENPLEEYERIYERFADMLDHGRSDMDFTPLRLIGDAFLVGKRIATDPFNW